MAKRQTREEKAAQFVAEQNARRAAEFQQRVLKARAMRTFDEKLLFAEGDRDPMVGVLYDLLHRYESATEDLKRRTTQLSEELAGALVKLQDNRHDVFSYSNPVATTGSEIEKAHHVRMALADAIATTARATGWWVPQVFDTRQRARHAQLCSFEVKLTTDDRDMFVVMANGTPLTGVDIKAQPANAAAPLVAEYETEESAWLAADAFHGQW